MVFGKRGDAPQEELIGTLYSDAASEPAAPAAPSGSTGSGSSGSGSTGSAEYRREPTEGILDSHARFNGKFVSDRDLRIDGEAQGEIECQGTLVLSPQARVRASIKAHNVVINGDYEGNVDSGGRFEIGSTGRVKGEVKTQVLVIKEGAFFEGSVAMTRKAPPEGAAAGAGSATNADSAAGGSSKASGGSSAAAAKAAAAAASESSIFSPELEEVAPAAAGSSRQPTGPGDDR
jgi:cytoskeletal protein CcmA (bactofilin family)